MERLAVIICSYNKKEYVVSCIESVFRSSVTDFDLIVVDNASTDGSAEELKRRYGNVIDLIVNEKNLGGSGGFNTGMRKALEKDYEYLLLLDNDVILDSHAIEESLSFITENPEVAVAGSKIYFLDDPLLMQELGADIDFEHFTIKPYFKNYYDKGDIPELLYCDYVPACSAMIRVKALKETGLMNESNFLYWDDIEWGYKFKLCGFKVAAYSKSIVWHKMGSGNRTNTMASYYFWRNRIKFFGLHCGQEQLECFCETIIRELFQAIYSCQYQKKANSIRTLMYAYDDASNGISGMAGPNRIWDADKIEDKFAQTFSKRKKIALVFNGDFKTARDFINKLQQINSLPCKIALKANGHDVDLIRRQFGVESVEETGGGDFDGVVMLCKHIFDVKEPDEALIYVDEYLNIAETPQDRAYCRGFDQAYEVFHGAMAGMLLDKLTELRRRCD